MKVLIITVAGMATRFAASLEAEKTLKCLYYEDDIKDCLLYQMLSKSANIDKYIIVGGYMYEYLKKILREEFSEFSDKLILVRNEHYSEYGSGYSLYKGLEKALIYDFDEVIFAEGDLYVDTESYERVIKSKSDVFTINAEPILAQKSVVVYLDAANCVHYVYDTQHGILEIDEPFLGVFNSGQIWKFADAQRVREKFAQTRLTEWYGTNLVYVQEYFRGLVPQDFEIIAFKKWINCNTVDDYRRIKNWRK